MPTVSFPVTIRISLDLPDFLAAPQQAPTADGAWQFTAARQDISKPVSQPESVAELIASFGLPVPPHVVTESEYAPAPVIVTDSSSVTASAAAPQPSESPQPHAAPQPSDPQPEAAPAEPQTASQIPPADDGQPRDTTLDGQEISPEQHTAIQLMLRGATMSKVAQAVGVHRNTVHRWKREDPRFRAVLNAHRNDFEDAARCKLEFLGNHAVNVLCTEVGNGNVRAAVQVVKGMGLFTGKPRERGSERADLVAKADAAAMKRARAEIAQSRYARGLALESAKSKAADRRKEEADRLMHRLYGEKAKLAQLAMKLQLMFDDDWTFYDARNSFSHGSGI